MAWRGLGSQLSPKNSPGRASRKDSSGLASSVREISRTRAVFRQSSHHSHTANLNTVNYRTARRPHHPRCELVPSKFIIFTGGYRGNHLQTTAASKVRADGVGAPLVTQKCVPPPNSVPSHQSLLTPHKKDVHAGAISSRSMRWSGSLRCALPQGSGGHFYGKARAYMVFPIFLAWPPNQSYHWCFRRG